MFIRRMWIRMRLGEAADVHLLFYPFINPTTKPAARLPVIGIP